MEILEPITDVDLLLDPTTPQGMAFNFIVNEDGYLSKDPCDATTIEQRYGLVTLYYATGGDTWTQNDGWLGFSHECNWFGVECHRDSLQVKDLELGKYNV